MKLLKNKKILFISLPIIAIILIFLLCLKLNINSNINNFENKINLLIENYNLLSEESIGYSISICDKKNQEKTFFIINDTNENTDENTNENNLITLKNDVIKFIKKNNYKTSWIKFNILKSKEETSFLKLYSTIMNNNKNSYPYGILFENNNDSLLLLSEQINTNSLFENLIIDKEEIFYSDIINYLENKNYKLNFDIDSFKTKIYTITEDGYFIDEKNNTYQTEYTTSSLNRRTDFESKKEISEYVSKNASEYLLNLIKSDGSFDYEYNMATDEKNDVYSIIRHAGSLWSLVKNFNLLDNKDNKAIKKINAALDYLINYSFIYDDVCYAESEDDMISLGACALTSCVLTDYYNYVDNDKKELFLLSKKLCDGMIKLQDEETGSIPHKLSSSLQVQLEYSIDYYDGEACLALIKMYDLTKQKKYLTSAKKLINEFYNNSEDNYYSHWFSYSILYLIENNINIDDINLNKFIIQTNNTALKYINRNSNSHVAFEYLSNCLNIYYSLKEKGKEYLIKNIDINLLNESIDIMFNNQLNTFGFEELTMFYKNPKRALNSFIVTSNQRLRIDDIQHSILGFNDYLDVINKFNLE